MIEEDNFYKYVTYNMKKDRDGKEWKVGNRSVEEFISKQVGEGKVDIQERGKPTDGMQIKHKEK